MEFPPLLVSGKFLRSLLSCLAILFASPAPLSLSIVVINEVDFFGRKGGLHAFLKSPLQTE